MWVNLSFQNGNVFYTGAKFAPNILSLKKKQVKMPMLRRSTFMCTKPSQSALCMVYLKPMLKHAKCAKMQEQINVKVKYIQGSISSKKSSHW